MNALPGLTAYIVSVDYTDVLAKTLPLQRRWFDRVFVITSVADAGNVWPVVKNNDAKLIVTDVFYEKGADFNKAAALEHALFVGGRHGWICLADADVVWSNDATFDFMVAGKLYSPLRYMYPCVDRVPPEKEWSKYPIHRNVAEWAGYTQIFHGSDGALGSPPWLQTNWLHGGGYDSFFQRKWTPENKVRPPWHCVHIGPAGANWVGRVTAYADGSVPVEADARSGKLKRYMDGRRFAKGDKFAHEKLR